MVDEEKSIAELKSLLQTGMGLEKCHKCGCMDNALHSVEKYALDRKDAQLLEEIRDYKKLMQPLAYDCLGCKRCWGAEVENMIDPDGVTCIIGAPAVRREGWPVVAGDYVLGNPNASLAVCTLGDFRLATKIIDTSFSVVAIAGKCDTENIGIEKIIFNLVANPRIRRLLLCGPEVDGHLSGDTILKLCKSGVDSRMRVVDAVSHRPVLKNVSLREVARFREQVQIIDEIGCCDVAKIAVLAQELAGQASPPLSIWLNEFRTVPHISARPPKRLQLDKLGFFVIITDPSNGTIACEHYANNGVLTAVIEGKNPAWIASTAIKEGMIGQLDHAAYLGRELARAELSLKLGQDFVQDQALGEQIADGAEEDKNNEKGS